MGPHLRCADQRRSTRCLASRDSRRPPTSLSSTFLRSTEKVQPAGGVVHVFVRSDVRVDGAEHFAEKDLSEDPVVNWWHGCRVKATFFGSKQSVVPTTFGVYRAADQGRRQGSAGAASHASPRDGRQRGQRVRGGPVDYKAASRRSGSWRRKTERGVTRHTYTYAWPPPRDETIARLLAGIWKHTTTKRVVTTAGRYGRLIRVHRRGRQEGRSAQADDLREQRGGTPFRSRASRSRRKSRACSNGLT